MNDISITFNGKKLLVKKGIFLSEIVNGEKPCGGNGKCGKCKVVAKGEVSPLSKTEKSLLTAKEIEDNVRLSCMTTVIGKCDITDIYINKNTHIITEGVLPNFEIAPVFKKYGVAVDIGTTTIAARIYDVNGNMLSDAACLNPQYKYGADVISRIESALKGNANLLSLAVKNAINDIIITLSKKAQISSELIDWVVITGNTVMLYLLLGESVEALSHAPFKIKRYFNEKLTAADIPFSSLSANTIVYIPPCISAFVGADITCGLITLPLLSDQPLLFTDIGTNGEIAFWTGEKLVTCSTAAGPAFEGVGISCGMRGEFGAIDKVNIINGKLNAHTVDNVKPVGICGSGLIDAVACMLKINALDESGFLCDDPFIISKGVSLTQKDIRMVQLAKSAICAGINAMLFICGFESAADIKLAIAGGFGRYLNIDNAIKIGLLPQMPIQNIEILGNSALSGAAMLLLNNKSFQRASELSQYAEIIDLSTNEKFKELYIDYMLF